MQREVFERGIRAASSVGELADHLTHSGGSRRSDACLARALEFQLSLLSTQLAPGSGSGARLALRTGDGLRINTAFRGDEAMSWGRGALRAELELLDISGMVRARAHSGFA